MTPTTPRATAHLLAMTTIALVLCLLPGVATAQGADTPADGHFIGPVGVTPRVSWQGMYDDNVFRSSEPISDVVSTLTADSGFRLQMRRIGLSGTASAGWVHFSQLARQRGANLGSSVTLNFGFTTIAPYATASYESTLERRNMEIDTRPRTERSNLTFGSVFRFSDRSSLDVAATRSNLVYDETDFAEGVNLAVALNQTADHYSLTFRQTTTPLTHLLLAAELQREHFDSSTYRNGDETRLSAGFQSDGFIKGHARAGLRIQRPYDPSISEVRGLFLSVSTDMTLVDRFQIGLRAGRDTEPSYRESIVYYDASSYGATLAYAVRPSIRVRAGAGVYFADYTETMAGLLPSAQQFGVERETRYESGVGFNLGPSLSLDLSGAYAKRKAITPEHQFDGLIIRAGVSHAF